LQGFESFFAYVERFDIVPQAVSLTSTSTRALQPNPVTQMYVLRRAYRADKRPFGDIVPLTQLRGPVQIAPLFGEVADPRLTMQNSLHYSTEFLLNKYSDKEIFWALV
jgi:hypothetical protein